MQDLIPDLIDIGIDVINPVQVSTIGMDPVMLKKRFGEQLSFWGEIDTQHILPYGKQPEVITRVHRIIP